MKRTTIQILLGLAALIGLGPTAAPADETTYTRQQDLTKPETVRPAGARPRDGWMVTTTWSIG